MSLLTEILKPNLQTYTATSDGRYRSTRHITHNGITIVIALGTVKRTQMSQDGEKFQEVDTLFFDYSILNGEDQDPGSQDKKSKPEVEKLDAQCWLENVKTLDFPTEVRVVGEEAVPVYQIPPLDRTGHDAQPGSPETVDAWFSTSVCLMDKDVTSFEVLSDGKYIYLFRQGLAASGKLPNKYMTQSGAGVPPVDGNLLCDRFTLVGSSLNKALEPRYKRSGQKRIPLNERDTLGVRDINDKPFYEPTFSLRFVKDLVDGWFTVLRTPTITNDMFRWTFFAYSALSKQIEYISTDSSNDGLFDLHGNVYYTCDKEYHANPVFATLPGSCTVSRDDDGKTCEAPRVPIVPPTPLTERALELATDLTLTLDDEIDLSDAPYEDIGFTLEAWFYPVPFWVPSPPENAEKEEEPKPTPMPPPNSFFLLFSQGQVDCPTIFLDDHLRPCIRNSNGTKDLAVSDVSLKVDDWNHVAFTYNASTRTISLFVDGVLTSATYVLPKASSPGVLSGLGSQEKNSARQFIGHIDEARLWSFPLHEATIKSRMKTRATGMEPFLEACWHFDEGEGSTAFDATSNDNTLSVTQAGASEPRQETWEAEAAPLVGNYGLARKRIRFTSKTDIRGGLSAVIYNEQVTVTEADTTTKAKPMKRGARVLLSFVVALSDAVCRLAVLDFGLLSDGQLCDFPASLPLPGFNLVSDGGRSAQRASAPLLYIDAQGSEIFGGVLAFDAARCASEAPCVFYSATGTITLFFRNTNGIFAALDYDVSRSMVAAALPGLGEHYGLLGTIKLRAAGNVSIKTDICAWAPKDVAVDLTVTAQLVSGTEIVETWKGIPSDVDKFCNLLNGVGLERGGEPIGKLFAVEKRDSSVCKIALAEPLPKSISRGTCISIGYQCYQVLSDARANDQSLRASWYATTKANVKNPKAGQTIMALGYDHENLVSCTGKPVGKFSLGSSIISLSRIESADTGESKTTLYPWISSQGASRISGEGQGPQIASPPRSTALRLQGDSVYSMLENAVTTPPCPGIAFEGWVKVDQVRESILMAYTSQRSERSKKSGMESQTAVLGVRASSSGNQYDLVGNVNGSLFSVCSPVLKQSQWVHFACSSRNTFGLRFNGSNYVDLGTGPEWNLGDFSLVFTLELDEVGKRDQVLITKAAAEGGTTPLHLKVTAAGSLHLSYWADGETGGAATQRNFVSETGQLLANVPYKVFISRKYLLVNRKSGNTNSAPRPYQAVTMRAWRSNGSLDVQLSPKDKASLESEEKGEDKVTGAAQTHGAVQSSDSPLSLAGATWTANQGLKGSMGPLRIYSSAIATPSSPGPLCEHNLSEKSLIASYPGTEAGGFLMMDALGRNNGKLKGDPTWALSPYEPDHQLSIYVNGRAEPKGQVVDCNMLQTPAGPHQLTLGNSIHGDGDTRYLVLANNFCGEIDEWRIWNVPRTMENICDSMHTWLSEIPAEVAVYLPFDCPDTASSVPGSSTVDNIGILADASDNCWHLKPLNGATVVGVPSEAPIGRDAPCVRHVLDSGSQKTGIQTNARPSVGEYGDMQVSASGSMEGAFKRMYSYINAEYNWCLVTGFRIGALVTEWVSQVQTAPTLKGYIEGAPPIPVESFLQQSSEPASSVKFTKAQSCSYSYNSQSETVHNIELSHERGVGVKWEASAGMGVMTEVSEGEVKGAIKTGIDISNAQVNTSVSTATTNSDMEMSVELTGTWVPSTDKPGVEEVYKPSNTGLALVESEVADVFALRLQTRGGNAPLVAYQMRPNPDIPRDKNLVSFEINRAYTKQGCLDGRNGLTNDEDYPPANQAPKDASYFKPMEAYAMRNRIRRAEEQRQGEFDRFSVSSPLISKICSKLLTDGDLPKRTQRNICNTYVWTADGGTFQETTSTMDVVQTESGGNFSSTTSIGASTDIELAFSTVQATSNVDAMYNFQYNLSLTKEKTSETSFALDVDFPPAVDIRVRNETTGKLVKRPGAVDAYRWMSFWLEESVEATDVFFSQVIDPQWLQESAEPNAALLRSLQQSIRSEAATARTKAWRVLHRCTYVSRVPEKVPGVAAAAVEGAGAQEGKKSTLLADVACNWQIIQNLEPWISGAKSRAELAKLVRARVELLYPRLLSQPRFYAQVLDFLAEYVGCS